MKSKDQPVELIGVPLDHGAGQRGVAMGPTALRIAGLTKALERLELNVIDGGDIAVPILSWKSREIRKPVTLRRFPRHAVN